MELDFYKLNTNGNDLLLLDFLHKEPPDFEMFPKIARRICKRHYGAGANGLVFLLSSPNSAVKIHYFLANGFQSMFFNDALLCTARYAFDSGISGKDKLTVETDTGDRTVEFIDSNNFRISLGTPKDEEMNEITENPDGEYAVAIEIDRRKIPITPIHLQGYGAVFFYSELLKEDLKILSGKILQNKELPASTQPVFVQIYSRDELSVTAWFDGNEVDYAFVCGLSIAASVLNGLTDREAVIHCNKKESFIQWNEDTNEIFYTGTAKYIFSGSFYLDWD